MRIGVIGTGRHGSRYAAHIAKGDIPGLTLTAISRRSGEGEKQARDWGCVWHADWQDLVRSPQVDAVVTAVPPVYNLAIARACANAGRHLLIEKPLAVDAASARAIVQVCAEAGVRLTVGHTLRYNNVVLALRRELASIGTLHAFHVSQRLEPILHPWLDVPELAGAGVIMHTAIHIFDTLRFVTGRQFLRVRALTSCRHNRHLEDLLSATVEMDWGLVGSIEASKVGRGRTNRYEFVGEAGELHGETVHNHLGLIQGTVVTPLDAGAAVATIVPLLKDWQCFLVDAGPNPVSGEDGAAAVEVAEAMLNSAAADRWIAVPPA